MGSRDKRRIPKPSSSSPNRLAVHAAESDDSDMRPPQFCFEFMESNFCISQQEKQIRSKFAERLRQLSQSSWQKLRQLPRKHGYETIPDKQIAVGIPKCRTPDTPIISVRCGDKARLIGYRNKRVFHILWVDASPFKVYSHS